MLFYLNSEDKTALEPVKAASLDSIGWLEKDLENLLAEHIDKLLHEDLLFVIAQARPMQPEPDVMALDEDGALYLFELKRGKSSAENVLQVLRYGQRFGQFKYDDLAHLFDSNQGGTTHDGNVADERTLQDAHRSYFDLNEPLPTQAFNKAQTFVLVTNGLDRETRGAIEYWHQQNVPIRSLVYRVFRTREDSILLEFDPFSPRPETMDEPDEGIFVVNTNIAYDDNAWQEMLEQNKAAAYRGRRFAITKVHTGSIVCLYHSGVGIVALGKAIGEYRCKSYGGERDMEFYVPCDFEIKVHPLDEPEKALPRRAINQQYGTGYPFRTTVCTLPKEYLQFIRSELRERQKQH